MELEKVILPEGLQKISRAAFYNCVELEKVVLPEGLQTIGQAAFYNCEKLTEINMPRRLWYIGERAFYGADLIGDKFIQNFKDNHEHYKCESDGTLLA